MVPNALDLEVLEDPGEEEMERVRERYQIRGRFVLYAGNIKPHKNLERLITAFSLLRRRGGLDDVRLVIVGSAEENKYAALRRTAEVTGVRNEVRFFGFVPDRTLARPVPHSPRSSRSRRSTRASACPRSRPWPAAPPW